jgi:topoisomerase IA-like protein
MHQWQKIYSTRNYAEASIIQGLLEENDIPVQVLNKQDSSYVNFGEIEIYVPKLLNETATQLMNQALLN